MKSLAALRREIDRVDGALLALLAKRGKLVREVAKAKARDGIAVRQPGREREVLARVARRNRGPYPASAVARIWKAILASSVALERIPNPNRSDR